MVPPLPVADAVHGATAMATPGPVPLSGVPLGDAVPGMRLLPDTLPVPQDLVCEGTAWAEKRTPGDPHQDSDGTAVAASRTHW
ncbi:hypothetical protein Mycch_2586 [Mycolicibacterium chubuense NBB4]|uniref:Uncharacterized protein n=1 Tax=Mycolicibacterium chubuense (strain NBB4) TaxID=710421 RepID=I4BJA1_MYCCN|nr:hypothetical protein [Mycolicibacterium chubuense]AFM17358.1 hypothetical protein Mycch_2586 [Mycolicibacterium chubuense NBB4]